MEYTDEFSSTYSEEELEYYTYPTQEKLAAMLGSHGLVLVAIVFVAFMGYKVIRDRTDNIVTTSSAREAQVELPAPPLKPAADLSGDPAGYPEGIPGGLPEEFASPYDKYTLTQGVHGASYGHMAIDIAAGQGAPIESPIHGVVTELYVDMYGNPTVVIENEVYSVMLLHGEYTVSIGEAVELGQAVGVESNLGYTTDMAGVPCWGRDCGYHTHLNVYDKRVGENVNPLELIGNYGLEIGD